MNPEGTKMWFRRTIIPIILSFALVGCAAEHDHAEGMRSITRGDPSRGLSLLAAASAADPGNSRYRMDFLQQRNRILRGLIASGDEARRQGRLDAARRFYASALGIDPQSDLALQGLADVEMDARHRVMLADAERLFRAGRLDAARDSLQMILLADPGNAAARWLRDAVARRRDAVDRAKAMQGAAGSAMRQPVTLEFRDANLRTIFEALSRTMGLNVIFDRDVNPDIRATIFVHQASLGDTVDMLLLQSHLEKKALNANTLFLYPATIAKEKEYRDLEIRVFQISDVDGKYIQALLKRVLKAADTSLNERTNTLVVRGTTDMIDIAAKIIAANDLPDPEVMLEVEVLEVSRDRLANLGIQWPSSFSVSTPTTVGTLSQLNHLPLNQWSASSLQATLNALMTDTDTNILSSPRIRVRDKQKAEILIGDKVPLIMNSVTPLATGTPVVTGTIQYLDVGIKLGVQPHIYREGDVGIKLNIEVSNIVKEISDPTSGSLAYEIGTRSAHTDLRLHDGETQILAGLVADQTNVTTNRVPILGQFPILDKIFGNENSDHSKDEIVLAITPHIVRAPVTADRHDSDVFSGTETTIRETPLRLDPVDKVNIATRSNASGSRVPPRGVPGGFSWSGAPQSPSGGSASSGTQGAPVAPPAQPTAPPPRPAPPVPPVRARMGW